MSMNSEDNVYIVLPASDLRKQSNSHSSYNEAVKEARKNVKESPQEYCVVQLLSQHTERGLTFFRED